MPVIAKTGLPQELNENLLGYVLGVGAVLGMVKGYPKYRARILVNRVAKQIMVGAKSHFILL